MTPSNTVAQRLAEAERLWLFLDYDGTLADFAPTPDHVEPDPDVISLVTQLGCHARVRAAIISGRRLGHIEKLVPVSGIFLAGTYGIELRMPDGERIDRVDYDAIRPLLEQLKPHWAQLIADRAGFYLEDKDWALALHARFAHDEEADEVLAQARRQADEVAAEGPFRVLGGHKFLEIGPQLAHKGRTVDYLLDRHPWTGALPLYVGDDDKDEEAFGVIQSRGGLAVVVSAEPRETQADLRLTSPTATRQWLSQLPTHWEEEPIHP
jgi:trehalose 6-phosphate phosphatase